MTPNIWYRVDWTAEGFSARPAWYFRGALHAPTLVEARDLVSALLERAPAICPARVLDTRIVRLHQLEATGDLYGAQAPPDAKSPSAPWIDGYTTR